MKSLQGLVWAIFLVVGMSQGSALAGEIDFTIQGDKVLIKPGEAQTVRAICVNQTAQPLTAMVRMRIEYSLAERVELAAQTVELLPKETKTLSFSWVSADKIWGCLAVGECLKIQAQGQTLLDTAQYFFTVSDNIIEASPGLGSTHAMGGLKPEEIRARVQGFADGGLPLLEIYAWQPSCWGEVMPKVSEWRTCKKEGGYFEKAENIRLFNDTAHEKGQKVFSYAQMSFRGAVGAAWLRQRPEDFLYHSPDGKIAVPDEEHFFETVNPLRETAMNTGLDQYVQAIKQLHFDGLRWDGHPGLWYDPVGDWVAKSNSGRRSWPYDHQGRPLLASNPDETNLAILRHMRQRVDSQVPNALWGFNLSIEGRQGGLDGLFPRTFRELATGNLMLHERHFASSRKDGRPNIWKNQKWSLVRQGCLEDADQARALGGYSYRGALSAGHSEAFMKYVTAFHFGSGAHIAYVNPTYMEPAWNKGKGWGYYPAEFIRFALRYNKFLFHPSLWRFDNATPFARVSVSNNNTPFPLLWEGHHFDLYSNKQYFTIVHIFNPPASDVVNVLDTPLPAWAAKDAVVSLAHPPVLDRGLTRYFALSPEWPQMCREVKAEPGSGGRVNLILPEFRYWIMLVAQYEVGTDKNVKMGRAEGFMPGVPF